MKKRLIPLLLLLLSVSLLCGCMVYDGPPAHVVAHSGPDEPYTINFGAMTIDYGGHQYRFSVTEVGTENPTVTIHYPNGATYYYGETSSGWSDDYDENKYASGEKLAKLVRTSYKGKNIGPGPLNYIGTVLLVGMGIVTLCFPEAMWHLEHLFKAWQYESVEPSAAGLEMTKIGGIIEIVMGVILFFVNWQ